MILNKNILKNCINIMNITKTSDIAKENDVNFLYSEKDEIFNNAVVLKEYLKR